MKLVSWMLLLMMLFFTFLTWHTANCDGSKKFIDRDTYELKSAVGQNKLEESKTNLDVKIISKKDGFIVVDEMRSPQCVNDCGCFGDAMKGSVGRSLTPKESLWKDIVLLYLVIWIFAAQKFVEPNTIKQNWIIIPVSAVLITFFCWVFNWYFPLLFGIISIVTSLWIYRSGGKLFGNHYGSILMSTFWSFLFVWYVLSYDPLKDYRPYAVGSNLKQKTMDGDPGERVTLLVYKNLKNGKQRSFDANGKEFLASNIWKDTANWIFDTTITQEIRPMRLPSITEQFNPFLAVNAVTPVEKRLKIVNDQLSNLYLPGLILEDVISKERISIAKDAYNIESYPLESYAIVGKTTVLNEELTEVTIRDFLFEADRVILIVAKNLKEINTTAIPMLNGIAGKAKAEGVPVVFIVNSDQYGIEQFRKKYGFNVPTFINDETEIKAISRSNPCLIVLKKGVVKGKYPYRSLPKFDWIKKNLLEK